MFFEHRGLLGAGPRAARHRRVVVPVSVPRRGGATTSTRCVADVRRLGADEGGGGRRAARADARPTARRCCARRPRALRERFDAGGRLLALGNGGSATDAMDARRRLPPPARAAWAPRPALDLTEDTAILTAIANDIGVEAIFARQVIAHGRPGDALLAFSTSGGSANVLAALAEARRRGLATIALVGYDGGADRRRGARRPRHRHALGAHPAHPGGPGERVPRAAGAGGVSAASTRADRASRVAGGGRGAGRRLPAVRAPARGRAAARRLRPQRRARRAGGGRGRAGARWRRSSRGCATTRRRWPWSSGCWREAVALAATRRLRDRRAGARRRGRAALVSADAATCEDCLAELFDPADRRYRYPFINCTNCGPRFTIVRGVPYDRPHTTMAGFAMCAACRAEYDGPARPPLPRAAERLPGLRAARLSAPSLRGRRRPRCSRGGAVVAVKGLGGFHLACVADDERGGGDAAGAQAPRGQAVRADGARRRGGRGRWWSWARRRRRCCARARARSCSRRGGRARRWPRRWRRAPASSG